jgi:hypothetical protein
VILRYQLVDGAVRVNIDRGFLVGILILRISGVHRKFKKGLLKIHLGSEKNLAPSL